MNRRPASEILSDGHTLDEKGQSLPFELKCVPRNTGGDHQMALYRSVAQAHEAPTPWQRLITVWIILAVVLVGTIVVARMLAADRAEQLARLEQLKHHKP